jgi:hypothetical protein
MWQLSITSEHKQTGKIIQLAVEQTCASELGGVSNNPNGTTTLAMHMQMDWRPETGTQLWQLWEQCPSWQDPDPFTSGTGCSPRSAGWHLQPCKSLNWSQEERAAEFLFYSATRIIPGADWLQLPLQAVLFS